jgi:NAD(P)-dependent dehydrogenase (short-subunit alcohol dehydrogenase family)
MSASNTPLSQLRGRHVVVVGSHNTVGGAVLQLARLAGAQTCAAEADFDPLDAGAWQDLLADYGASQPLYLLVNAAQTCVPGNIQEVAGSAFHEQFWRNAYGAWLGLQAGIATLRRGGGGQLINITSVLGRRAVAGAAAYCAAARGVIMATKSAALECARARDGIVVNAVLAGRLEGDAAHFPDGRLLQGAPVVEAAQVASAALYLATDGGTYISGVDLPVDGGWLAQ